MGRQVQKESVACPVSTPSLFSSTQLLSAYTSIALEIPQAGIILTKHQPRKFAILLCGHGSEYIRNCHGGVAALIVNMLGDNGEMWDTFHVVDGDFPSDDNLCKYDGFVITGSYEDAHGNRPWVLQLCNVVRQAYRMNKKLLGICFGHQVICRSLGGKTGRAAHGWELGLKEIVLAESKWFKSYAQQMPSSLHVLEAHQDEVTELPPGAEVMGSSPTTCVEIFAMGHQVLGIQGHPELTEDIAFDIVHNYSRKHGIPEEVVAMAETTLQDYKNDTQLLRQLCKSFMKTAPCSNRTFNHNWTQTEKIYEAGECFEMVQLVEA